MNIKIKGLAALSLIGLIAWVMISNRNSTFTHLKQGRVLLQALSGVPVTTVMLTPTPNSASLVKDTVRIQDAGVIKRLVNDYQNLSSYRPGQGKWGGRWQVKVSFLLADGRLIDTQVSHNDFADLVFIPTPEKNFVGGPSECFADNNVQDIGKLLEQYRYARSK